MMERAIEALKANEGAALKAFNDEKNKEFRDRDLYIYSSIASVFPTAILPPTKAQ